MPESSIVVRPQPMDSETYTASSRLQAAGLAPAIAVFERAATQVPLPTAPQPIVLADYGAGTGHNSLLPLGAAIKVLRSRTSAEFCTYLPAGVVGRKCGLSTTRRSSSSKTIATS